jgi:hypothetical protein
VFDTKVEGIVVGKHILKNLSERVGGDIWKGMPVKIETDSELAEIKLTNLRGEDIQITDYITKCSNLDSKHPLPNLTIDSDHYCSIFRVSSDPDIVILGSAFL